MKNYYFFALFAACVSILCLAIFDDTRNKVSSWLRQKKEAVTQSKRYQQFKEGFNTQYKKLKYRLKTSKSDRVINLQKELKALRIQQEYLKSRFVQVKKTSEEWSDLAIRLYAIEKKIDRLKERLLQLQK